MRVETCSIVAFRVKQNVREKCRGFVVPPVFPFSSGSTFKREFQIVTQKFTHLSKRIELKVCILILRGPNLLADIQLNKISTLISPSNLKEESYPYHDICHNKQIAATEFLSIFNMQHR